MGICYNILMTLFYRSQRVGKKGKLFTLYKFKTLNEGYNNSFVQENAYKPLGHFLRKTKLDEFPQLWNVLKGDLNLVGPRPEEERTIDLIPEDIKGALLSRRPGLTSLASLHFFDEGQLLEKSPDPYKDYWERIKPMKFILDVFYIQNRDILLDFWIIWRTMLLMAKSLIGR